ncbi:unnamed protein product [Arabidopsis lyrata]|nr:unnamed protein product [Arabidopsis lyrata]
MDLADALVVQSMFFYRMDVGTPANMLVLSSDPDFATTVATLKSRGVTVFVAAEQDANPILLRSGDAGWYWSKLINGEGSDF